MRKQPDKPVDDRLFRAARSFEVTDEEWHGLTRWFRESCPESPAELGDGMAGAS
jgi:hypothetical protein